MQMWHLPAIFAADLLVGFYFFRKGQICANPFLQGVNLPLPLAPNLLLSF